MKIDLRFIFLQFYEIQSCQLKFYFSLFFASHNFSLCSSLEKASSVSVYNYGFHEIFHYVTKTENNFGSKEKRFECSIQQMFKDSFRENISTICVTCHPIQMENCHLIVFVRRIV
jgi:hypothetical protein